MEFTEFDTYVTHHRTGSRYICNPPAIGTDDDYLVKILIFKYSTEHIENQINKYLKELDNCLIKWKLKMSPEKCNYTVFRKNFRQKCNFPLNLLKYTVNWKECD